MVDNDHSVTNAFLLITTLVGTSILLSQVKERVPVLAKWLDGLPFVIINDGQLDRECMRKARVEEAEILTAARRQHGLERLDQIKYAVVEQNGDVTIVPRK